MHKTARIFAGAAVLASALFAPVSAHAGMVGDLFSKMVDNVADKVGSTLEWVALNSPTYLVWKTVTLPSGACGDGSPYRIFINQSPTARNTVVFFEGGGACWDYGTCMGGTGFLGATNPQGLARNYMYGITPGTAFGSVAEPLINRIGFGSPTPTRSLDWNYVYLPYCTGDVHVGNNVRVYKKTPSDPASASRTQYFKGHVNVMQAANWLAEQKNHPILKPLAQPETLLVTGISAGAFGIPFNYSWLRTRLNPKQSGLLSDSGWLPHMPSPRTSASKFRGVAIRALDDWNVTGKGGVITHYEQTFKRAFAERENVGQIVSVLSAHWPQDRFIFAQGMADRILPSFANVALADEPAWTEDQKVEVMEDAVRSQLSRFDQLPNVGYYVPFGRDWASAHCLTVVTFDGTRVIPQTGPRHDSVNTAVLSALHRTAEPVRALDATRDIQKTLPGMLRDALMKK